MTMAEEIYGDSLAEFFYVWMTGGSVPVPGSRWAR